MFPSKLSALCDKIIEVGWLASVIIVPLFFSLYSARNAEPDKLALFRSIATIMAAAWLLKWIEQRGLPRSRTTATFTMQTPLVFPTLLLVVVYLLTTLTSVAPWISFFGTYFRPQGTYAILSYSIIFAMIVQGLRTRRQLDRLIWTIILSSVPVALYALVQKSGLDPLTWLVNGIPLQPGSTIDRPPSSMGNAIFLSGYLILCLFLTLERIVRSMNAARTSNLERNSQVIKALAYTIIAITQFTALVAAGSRGPFAGWLAGLALFACFAFFARRRLLMLGLIGVGLASLVFAALPSFPTLPFSQTDSRNQAIGNPSEPLPGGISNPSEPLPGVIGNPGNLIDSRLGDFSPGSTGPGTGLQDRLLIGERMARLVLPHPPLYFSEGLLDPLNLVRPLIGYGPDAIYLVSPQVDMSAEYKDSFNGLLIDRSHNEIWDMLGMTGVIGLVAYQLLFLSIFIYGLRWLGLLPTHRDRNILIASWVALGLAGAFAAIVLGQPKYLGLTIPAGNIVGLLFYLLVFGFRSYGLSLKTTTDRQDQVLLGALLAAVFGHYIEIQFGLPVPGTQLVFWIIAGILVVVGSGRLGTTESAVKQPAPTPRPTHAWMNRTVGFAFLSALTLSTLLFSFMTYPNDASDPLAIFWRTLSAQVQGSPTYVVLFLLLATWVLTTAAIFPEFTASSDWRRSLAVFAALSIGTTLLFGLGLAWHLSTLTNMPATTLSVDGIIARADQTTRILDYYLVSLFALLFLISAVLASEHGALPRVWIANRWSWIALIPLLLVTWLGVYTYNLNPLRAETFFGLGKAYSEKGQSDAAIALNSIAVRALPAEDFYYMELGRTFLGRSTLLGEDSRGRPSVFDDHTRLKDILDLDPRRIASLNRNDLLYAAQTMLTQARDLNPLYTDHTINLARFYLPSLPVDSPTKLKLADLSNKYYGQAVRLDPNNAALPNEWASLLNARADFDLTYKNDPDGAIQKLRESLTRDAKFEQTYLYLGKAYMVKGDINQVIETYQKALALQPKFAEVQSKLAFAYFQQGKITEAIQAYQKFTEIAPKAPNLWEAHKNLALLFEQTGDFSAAVREAQVAAQIAPVEYQTQLSELLKRLQIQTRTP